MHTASKSTLKAEVYQKLKLWDRKRAQVLRFHKKAAQQITEAVQKKVEDSKDFLNSLETMLEERVSQVKAYCSNSVVDSELVFDKNKHEAYANHYQLLKYVYMIEAEKVQQAAKKLSGLTEVLNDLKGVLANSDSNSSSHQKSEETSLANVKANIKYLVDCDLPEIVEEVTKECDKVSKIYNENRDKDLYFAIQGFVRLTQKQTNKHRQIGRELINFVSASMKRQISVQNKIRICLRNWSQIDGPIDNVFLEQLDKKQPNYFVKDFFDMEEMTNVSYEQQTIEDFLINFKIDDFHEHDRMKLCDVDGFYNSKIETRIIVTMDCYVHLVRINAHQPDFSLRLNPQLIIKKNKECSLLFAQYAKKFYFKKQKQYEFTLQFNTEEDLHYFKTVIEKASSCKVE